MLSIRTDLAVEAREIYKKSNKREVPGVKVDVEEEGNIRITTVEVENEVGAKIIGKPIGIYITMEVPGIRHYDADFHDELSKSLAKQISKLVHLEKIKLPLL